MIQIAESHGYPALPPSPRPHVKPWETTPCHAPARVPARGNEPASPYPHRTARCAAGRRSAVPHPRHAAGLMAALAFIAAAAPRAETLFITDRIGVGLHRSPDPGSAIVAVVPSDTALEVVAREGALIHVETPGGASGWVAATYVTADRPARAVLSEVERRADDQARKLARARERIGDLEQRLAESGERNHATPAETGAGREEARAGTPTPDDARQEMRRLAEENRRMQRTVAGLRAELEAQRRRPREPAGVRQPAAPAPRSAGTPRAPPPVPLAAGPPPAWPAWKPWHWMLAGFTALLLLSAGGYVVDWRIRRRHGGFRL